MGRVRGRPMRGLGGRCVAGVPRKTVTWREMPTDIDEHQQRRLAEPFERGKKRDQGYVPILTVRSRRGR